MLCFGDLRDPGYLPPAPHCDDGLRAECTSSVKAIQCSLLFLVSRSKTAIRQCSLSRTRCPVVALVSVVHKASLAERSFLALLLLLSTSCPCSRWDWYTAHLDIPLLIDLWRRYTSILRRTQIINCLR